MSRVAPTEAARPAARPDGRRSRVRLLLLVVTAVVAVCGFTYELILIALGTALIGNTVLQTSLVLATFVTTMGLGSLLTKPLQRRPVEAFLVVEALVALIGGLSALALYVAFAWLDLYQPAMLATASLVGLLVGAEIPLLVVLLQRARREAAGTSVADLLAADYLGAVVAGLAFPLLILPTLGEIRAALAIGIVNALAGVAVLVLFRRTLAAPRRLALGALIVGTTLVLVAALVLAGRIEARALQQFYDDPITLHERTRHQDITLTESLDGRDRRLYLNGDLQFSSVDEYRYHEPLVHPAMAGPHGRVAVLGGGDGLALREVLRYPGVREVVEVELDPRVIELAREDPDLRTLNAASLDDPRVQVVTADAFAWARRYSGPRFDVVVADFPDPDAAPLAKLYAVEFYALVRARLLAPGGRLVVQAGSPFFARDAFWCVERTLQVAGYGTRPYHVDVPSFGDWGFVLAALDGPPRLRLDDPGGLRYLDGAVLAAAEHFGRDVTRTQVRASTLDRPTIVTYTAKGWRND